MLSELTNIVRRQKAELPRLLPQPIVVRGQVTSLRDGLPSPLVKVITGPRRVGKSTLALQCLEGRKFAYLNFEDELLPSALDGDQILRALHESYGEVDYYFFDEIQNLDRWEQFLNRMLRLGQNVIVTGSNARLLSEELASALTGRHMTIELLPFSFAEALGCYAERGKQAFLRYLVQGGFPEVVLGRSDARSYLSTLWEAIVIRDIASRRRIRNIAELRNLLGLFLASVGSRYNADSLTRSLNQGLSAPTVKRFLGYGVEAYLCAELTRFMSKPRQRLKSDRKAYVIDNGFFTSRHTGVFDDYPKLLENLVFVELWRRGHRPNLDLFYYQTRNGHEVDFLVRQGHRSTELIQVCVSLGSQRSREREFRALLEASEELGVKNLTVVTLDETRSERHGKNRMEVVSAADWLSQSTL